MECTNSEYETAFPGDLFQLLFSTYIDSGKAEELYIKMRERVDYLNEEYDEYDEDFLGWEKENIVGYRPDMIIAPVNKT